MKPPRTCDRCYKIKARCLYDAPSTACVRCTRLGHVCETRRAVLQPGRPRTASKLKQPSSPKDDAQALVVHSATTTQLAQAAHLSSVLKGFKQHEVSLIEFVLHPDQISSLVYGPTFHGSMRSAIADQLFAATDELKDGFLAFATALSESKKVTMGEPLTDSQAERRSRALQKLGDLPSSSADNARVALALALMLITYNDLSLGTTTLPISRAALLRALPWQQQLITSNTETTDPNIICLLFVEVAESLAQGKIPIFRYEPPEDNTITDRYYGVSHELLPYLYDICILYKAIKARSISTHEMAYQIQRIEADVDQWDPEAALLKREGIISDKIEQRHFLLQARAYKSATQLLLLQAQRSYLINMLALSKAKELEGQVFEVIRQGTDRPKYLLFPYFVACLELYGVLDGLRDKVLANMNDISNGLAPMACQSMFACLKHIWRNREQRPDLTWFECINDGLLFAMGP